jgi:pyridoxine 4-dehydrogenase
VRWPSGELDAASDIVEIASVQNLYNLTERRAQKIVDVAARRGIAFIPWYPLATGNLADPRSITGVIAHERGVSASQVALAWLLAASPASPTTNN